MDEEIKIFHPEEKNSIYLDLGCGTSKKEHYIGIDRSGYPGVEIIQDLRFTKLPYEDGMVDGVFSSHFQEHLTFEENVWMFNEVYRVMKVGGIFEIVVPHGLSFAGMADLSHKTFWTEDTFGYFSPENTAHYSWDILVNGETVRVINRWEVLKNDQTPPYEYTVRGWVELKSREIHAYLKKLP